MLIPTSVPGPFSHPKPGYASILVYEGIPCKIVPREWNDLDLLTPFRELK
jgi:hypothetical protein